MTSRRFFAVLWRMNAVFIFLTTVLGCIVLAFAAREIYKQATRTRQATGVVNVAEEETMWTHTRSSGTPRCDHSGSDGRQIP